MLSKHNKINDDIRLQHALLSALRNLTIPVQNKSNMIALGLVDIIYPMLMSEQYPVIFKLLGTLRMAIDGQGNYNMLVNIPIFFSEQCKIDWI